MPCACPAMDNKFQTACLQKWRNQSWGLKKVMNQWLQGLFISFYESFSLVASFSNMGWLKMDTVIIKKGRKYHSIAHTRPTFMRFTFAIILFVTFLWIPLFFQNTSHTAQNPQIPFTSNIRSVRQYTQLCVWNNVDGNKKWIQQNKQTSPLV